MIPNEVEKDFKTILNVFKRLGKGIYKNEKDAMQNIYANTELLFQNNVKQNPIFIKILSLLVYEYILKYGDGKNAVQMIAHNVDTKVDLMYFKISDLLSTIELTNVVEAFESDVINEGQKDAILKSANKWKSEHIEKSIITLANELIFNERANEL